MAAAMQLYCGNHAASRRNARRWVWVWLTLAGLFGCSVDNKPSGDSDTGVCDRNNGGCNPLVECSEEDGNAICGACVEGTTDVRGDATDCQDIDECRLGTDDCDDDPQASCLNVAPGFLCACPPGTTDHGAEQGRDCRPFDRDAGADGGGTDGGDGGPQGPLDECAMGLDTCDDNPAAACADTLSGYTCTCPEGFVDPAGRNCLNLNECVLGNDTCDTDPPATCMDTAGSYACICPGGYADPDGRDCQDIDECDLGTDLCDDEPEASCVNTDGSHDCTCPTGYADPLGRDCLPVCGDGLLRGEEACDDHDTDDLDGCDENCEVELGFDCDLDEPTNCIRQCGNRRRDERERCDDGNLLVNDGCDDVCDVEASYVCARFPSRCLLQSGVALVDDDAACPGSGTLANPYCSITAALGTAHSVMIVRPGEYRENVSVASRTLEIIAEDGALLLAAAGSPALHISNSANVTVTGLSIRGGTTRVSVENAAAAIQASTLGPASTGPGLVTSGSAALTLTQSRIVGNPGGGIDVAGSGGLLLENCIVHDNGTTTAGQAFGGVRVGTQAAGAQLLHLTVADNRSESGTRAGIVCEPGDVNVQSSIVWGNLAASTTTGVSSACNVSYSDVQPAASGTGNMSVAPGFVLPTYHLAGNSALVNLGAPASTSVVDYDGRTRPFGGRVEMGAVEIAGDSPFPTGRGAVLALDEPSVGRTKYLSLYPLGLYSNHSQVMPSAHKTEGLAWANTIEVRDLAGNPNASGRVVFLGLGGSDVSEMFCTEADDNPPIFAGGNPVCTPRSLSGRVQLSESDFVEPMLTKIVNGAYPNQYAGDFSQEDEPVFGGVNGNYDRIRDRVLGGYINPLSENQVQALYIQLANESPVASLPDRHADAVELMVRLGNVLRLARERYPNLRVALLSGRPYSPAGVAHAPNEPFAYETGLAVKWLIQAQVEQMANDGTVVDTRAGDLDYEAGAAPWIAWGPYLGNHPTPSQKVGARFTNGDFDNAPNGFFSDRGEAKASLLLLHHVSFSPFTKCWLMSNALCE